MTQEKFSITDFVRAPSAQKIKVVYDVKADADYHVTRWFQNSASYIAVLTRRGSGHLVLRTAEETVTAEELFLVYADELRSYEAGEDGWDFWWFEFDGDYPLLKPNIHYPLPQANWHEDLCSECLELLLKDEPEAASALFTAMCYLWKVEAGVSSQSDEYTLINSSLAYICANIDTVTVADMAAQLAVSERTLRNLYYRYTGESPLQVLQSMRMKEAKHLLVSSSYTVSEISERLGYKSSFYFSRLFKSVHNVSPTEYRKRSNQYQTLYARKYKK